MEMDGTGNHIYACRWLPIAPTECASIEMEFYRTMIHNTGSRWFVHCLDIWSSTISLQFETGSRSASQLHACTFETVKRQRLIASHVSLSLVVRKHTVRFTNQY